MMQGIKEKPLLYLLVLTIIVRMLYLLLNYPLWWDSHVYIGIGKYIFSGGELGIWESFRPLIHPLILGTFWKFGLNPFIVGKLLDILWSVLGVYFLYKITEVVFNKKTAIVAGLIFSLNPLFILFTGLILADPLVTFLGLAGIYLIITKRWFSGGIILGLAFLTRFPYGIWFGAVSIALLFKREEWKKKIKELFLMGVGFILPIIPYLILNYFKYRDAFTPFTAGSWIVTTSTWLYGTGITYYVTDFFLIYPIFLLYFGYVFLFIKKKQWKDSNKTILVAVPLLVLIYFLTVPRKEVRYMMTLLPFLAIVSAHMIIYIYDIFKRQRKPFVKPFAFIIICVLFLVMSFPSTLWIERTPVFYDEIDTIIDKHEITGTILSSDPSFVSYLDQRIVTLDGTEFASAIYEREREEYELLFINDCDLPCQAENPECKQRKQDFLEKITQENKEVFKKEYVFRKEIETEKYTCTYTMYIPKK